MSDGLPSIEDLLKQAAPADNALVSPVSANNKIQTPITNTKLEKTETKIEEPTKKPEEQKKNKKKTISPKIQAKTRDEMSPEELLQEKIGDIKLKSKEMEVEKEATSNGFPYINLKGFAISTDALTVLSEERARKLNAICFLHTGPELRLGAVDPNNTQIKDLVFQLGEQYKTHSQLYKISQESFDQAIKLYTKLPKIRKIIKGVQITQEELEKYQNKMDNFKNIQTILKDASITDILSILIAAALKMNSSDIHIEAEEKEIVIRLRVDGMLQKIATINKSKWKKIINRIKLIADLKLNINDQPQDGRFTIFQKNQKIDVRTSTLPTAWGESIVMRILNPDSIKLAFEELGFRPAALKRLETEIGKPYGMIITTGPTGSGKTTTLYAILRQLNKPNVKIITLEDPIEYKLDGINQSQINHSKDYTFSKGLRSILRQDPDILLVGEIRDLETARTAIQAALTGHLLLSTIHTNDAAGALPRFISMGVEPSLLAPAINAIMGQRLLRRICEHCKAETKIDEETVIKIKEALNSIPESSGEIKPNTTDLHFFKGKGCSECNNTGYKGRVGAYEILIKDEAVEKVILSGKISEYQMREVASKQGMVTMLQDGLLKAVDGLTSIEEVQRVLGL